MMYGKTMGLAATSLLAVLSLAAEAQPVPASASGSVAALIRRAGEAPTDAECLAQLRVLSTQKGLPPHLKKDLARLLSVVSIWTTSKSLYENERPFRGDPMHLIVRDPNSPLYPLACYYRGRILLWMAVESGPMPRGASGFVGGFYTGSDLISS